MHFIWAYILEVFSKCTCAQKDFQNTEITKNPKFVASQRRHQALRGHCTGRTGKYKAHSPVPGCMLGLPGN